jgi:hypothetical protein
MTVCGFEYLFAGFTHNARTPAEDTAGWVCREIKSTLVRMGHDSWCVMMHRAEATGSTAEEAFRLAYERLDAKSDEIAIILNRVHERSGLKT